MSGSILISTLTENTSEKKRLLAEYGLSMLVEVNGKKILFDTGPGMSLQFNASVMNIDLMQVEKVVLSHGHYDHTGGLKAILEPPGLVDIHAHDGVFTEKYRVVEGHEPIFIGNPWSKYQLEQWGARLVLKRGPQEITDRVMLTGEIPRTVGWETGDESFRIKSGGDYVEDPILDDQAMVMMSTLGPVVMVGCAHAGIVNTLKYVLKLIGEKKIYAVIGGLHLKEAGTQRIAKTINILEQLGVQKIGTCHCTGLEANLALFKAFGEKVFFNHVGKVFCL